MTQPLPLAPHDLAAYGALTSGTVWFESGLVWSSFRGPKAVDALNGLITNDVAALHVGHAHAAAALTPKGKMVCDMLVFRAADETLLVGVEASAGGEWLGLVRKYVNPRLAKITDETGVRAFRLIGPAAERVAQGLKGAGSDGGSEGVQIVTLPMPGQTPAMLVVGQGDGQDALQAQFEELGAVRGSDALWTVSRVESGIPRWGADMDENTIPQEANLDTLGAISFTKGCYTGQETVARIHFRGHVNRHLRGLISTAPLVTGGKILDATGKTVGDVRTTAISPVFGPIALAMVRREVEVGSEVTIEGSEGPVAAARVSALPFWGA